MRFKVDFWSSLQLRLSSKEGKTLADPTCQYVVLDVKEMIFSEQVARLRVDNEISGLELAKQWRYIRDFKKLPLFSVAKITIMEEVSVEYITGVLDEIRTSKLKRNTLCWKLKEDEPELFLKCVEKFNITKVSAEDVTANSFLVRHPKFLQMESMHIRIRSFHDEVFLSLQSHSISFSKDSQNYVENSIINRLLKQWITNEREIRSLELPISRKMGYEKLLFNIPVLLIYSKPNYNHKLYTPLRGVYILNRGDKRLRIDVESNHLSVMEVEDHLTFEPESDKPVEHEDMQKTTSEADLPSKSWTKKALRMFWGKHRK